MSKTRISTYDIEPEVQKFDPHLFQSVDTMIIEERNKEVKKLALDMAQLNDSYSDLSSLVASQGTEIDLAADAIEYGAGATRAAQLEVEKAENYVARRRRVLATLAGVSIAAATGLLAVSYLFKPESPNAK